MTEAEVMAALRAAGSEQTRKTYLRHGATGELFGVKYADLYRLQKKIKVDQPLAEQLWATGNHDAQVLACLIADPARMSAGRLDAWARAVDGPMRQDALARLAVLSPTARQRAEKWMASKNEWVAATGWSVLAGLAGRPDGPGDEDFEKLLRQIEAKIHQSPNRVRHAMNAAVIAIGLRGGRLREAALASAARIGRVEVDHGDTACKTPDAAEYIRKAESRPLRKGKSGC